MDKLWKEFLDELTEKSPSIEKLAKILASIRDDFNDNEKFREALRIMEEKCTNEFATDVVVAASRYF